jgi:hypothetical protein
MSKLNAIVNTKAGERFLVASCPECSQKLAMTVPLEAWWIEHLPVAKHVKECRNCSAVWDVLITLQPCIDPAVKVYFVDFSPADPSSYSN